MHHPLVFGGAFFSEMDMTAAICAKRFLFNSPTCSEAVTHKVLDLEFCRPTYLGDLIRINAEVVSVGKKSLNIVVKAYRETKRTFGGVNEGKIETGMEYVAGGKFVFVSIASCEGVEDKPDLLPYAPHLIPHFDAQSEP